MSTGVEIGKPAHHQLQAISVQQILLVSSVYDSFIFEGIIIIIINNTLLYVY